MTAGPLLCVHNVARSFGSVRAVDGVSFELGRGELTALIGPNGAGKSTLFNVITGALSADTGQVSFNGAALDGDAGARARRGVGRTFQTAQAFGSMNLRETVRLALAVREGHSFDCARALWALSFDEAEALLARVGLRDAARRAASEIPYADLKRLELAIALAGRPQLLLMDEPTAGMAPAERIALMDRVRDIASDGGTTVLFTEHSMDVVFGYARRVLVLARGKLIADGAPDAVRADAAAQAAYLGEAA